MTSFMLEMRLALLNLADRVKILEKTAPPSTPPISNISAVVVITKEMSVIPVVTVLFNFFLLGYHGM